MLPGGRRIRQADDFRAVTRTGNRCATRTLVVHVGTLPGSTSRAGTSSRGQVANYGPARAGFVVGRSVGGAVVRNRVVRRLRHLMAPLLADLPDGIGVVVRALPASASASSPQLEHDLVSALGRCRLVGVGQPSGTVAEVTQ